jgi:hypothetical protein
MSRPLIHDAPDKPPPKFPQHRTFAEIVKSRTDKREGLEN